MNENIYANIFVVIALLVIFAVVFLIPQAIGLGVYRFLKPRNVVFAALAGFLLPLILYGAVVGYLWFGTKPTPASELPSGEGDMVGPAIAGFGLIMNVGGGMILYSYLFAKNLRRTTLKNESGTNDLP